MTVYEVHRTCLYMCAWIPSMYGFKWGTLLAIPVFEFANR